MQQTSFFIIILFFHLLGLAFAILSFGKLFEHHVRKASDDGSRSLRKIGAIIPWDKLPVLFVRRRKALTDGLIVGGGGRPPDIRSVKESGESAILHCQ